MKKFELTGEFVTNIFGKKLFRIRALVAFGNVEAGELGGYVEKEENLSDDGNAWVSGDAWVYGDAQVSGNARVSGNAWVYGDARVYGNAWVYGDDDILQITGLGTVHRTTTVFRTTDGIRIACGCFYGDLDAFREQVKNTREGKVQREYLKFADLVEIYFGVDEEDE